MLDPEAITDHLEAEHGDVLRGVLFFTQDGHTLTSIRTDLAERYTEEHLRDLARWGREEAKGTAGLPRLGSILTSVRIFERATVVNFVIGNGNGLLVSFDPDADDPTESLGGLGENLPP